MPSINLIPNGDFSLGAVGALPDSWSLESARAEAAPVVRKAGHGGFPVMVVEGSKYCAGVISAPVRVQPGASYLLEACFKAVDGFDAYRSLFFTVATDDGRMNDGIVEYKKHADGWIRGQRVITVPAEGSGGMHIKIYAKYIEGRAAVRSVSLGLAEQAADRWVRVGVSSGQRNVSGMADWAAALDRIGGRGADVALIIENFSGSHDAEELGGESFNMMCEKAAKWHMYVSGTYYFHDTVDDMFYNCQALIDRDGKLIGHYYKAHPFDPEPFENGTISGTEAPVFETDFGRVGCWVCYDNWFPDMAELVALKGAELALVPAAGYYRRLIAARATDNGLWVAASSLDTGSGIWDPCGEEIIDNKNDDYSKFCPGEAHFKDAYRESLGSGNVEIAGATINLAKKPSPHNWGGPVLSAPGGRKTRRSQRETLYAEIEREYHV